MTSNVFTIRAYVNGGVVERTRITADADDLAYLTASIGDALTLGPYDSARVTASDARGIVVAAAQVA